MCGTAVVCGAEWGTAGHCAGSGSSTASDGQGAVGAAATSARGASGTHSLLKSKPEPECVGKFELCRAVLLLQVPTSPAQLLWATVQQLLPLQLLPPASPPSLTSQSPGWQQCQLSLHAHPSSLGLIPCAAAGCGCVWIPALVLLQVPHLSAAAAGAPPHHSCCGQLGIPVQQQPLPLLQLLPPASPPSLTSQSPCWQQCQLSLHTLWVPPRQVGLIPCEAAGCGCGDLDALVVKDSGSKAMSFLQLPPKVMLLLLASDDLKGGAPANKTTVIVCLAA